MPIDRHTSGDDFDRSDDARVTESEQQQADARTKEARPNKTAPKSARKTATKTGAGAPPAGGSRPAKATDKAKTKTAARAAAKSAAKRTAKSRAGNTAQSKQTAMKALAQKELAQKALGKTALGKTARLKTARFPGPLAGTGLAEKSEEDRARRKAETAGRAAGNGIIWSLLALGLAACGGGTNTVRGPALQGPAGAQLIRRPARPTTAAAATGLPRPASTSCGSLTARSGAPPSMALTRRATRSGLARPMNAASWS